MPGVEDCNLKEVLTCKHQNGKNETHTHCYALVRCEAAGTLIHCWWEHNGSPQQKTVCQHPLKLNLFLPQDTAIPLLTIHLTNVYIYSPKGQQNGLDILECSQQHVRNSWKQLKCLSEVEQVHTLQYIPTMDNYAELRMNETMLLATAFSESHSHDAE